MCNLYDIGPKREGSRLESLLTEILEGLPKLFGIRKTDQGAIIRSEKSGLVAMGARWGFRRDFNPSVNNARDDKLVDGMWRQAWNEKRRCVIPASCFYEWTGPKGRKQTYAIEAPGGLLWMAGLWEMSTKPDIGLCFTTLTTSANPTMTPLHDRMPVILDRNAIEVYLASDSPLDLVQPYPGALKAFPCQNPLSKGAIAGPPVSEQPPQQGLLF